jgi:hypothetical protein
MKVPPVKEEATQQLAPLDLRKYLAEVAPMVAALPD